jgi:hypothetical protein
LFHVALSEVRWQDLCTDSKADVQQDVQIHRALNRAAMLYDSFLAAASRGPSAATKFLAKQHALQHEYLMKSQTILARLQRDAAGRVAAYSEMAFGAQMVKSTATAAVAIIGLLITGSAAVTAAAIGLGFDVTVEMVNRLGPANHSGADAVVIGFKQTVANDVTGLVGEARKARLEATKNVMEKTLKCRMRSSKFRSVVASSARLDVLLKTLGYLSAGITIYSEVETDIASYGQMQAARHAYSALQSSH